MMVEKEILSALQSAAIAAVATSLMPSIPIKPVMRTEPQNNGKWLEFVYIPNNIVGEFWSTGKTYRGLFRLIFHWPSLDEGAYSALDVIASVCAHFPIGAVFQSGGIQVKITAEPDLASVIEAAPDNLYPVTIRYEFFQP